MNLDESGNHDLLAASLTIKEIAIKERQMGTSAKAYLAEVWGLWNQKISGWVLAIITIAAAIAAPFFVDDSHGTKLILIIVAALTGSAVVILVFVSQYEAWRAERERYESELAKNARPEIRGGVHSFEAGVYGDMIVLDKRSCNAQFTFHIEVSNVRLVHTNVREMRLEGSAMKIPAVFEFKNIWGAQETWTPVELLVSKPLKAHPSLPPGVHVELVVRAEVTVDGYYWDDLGRTLNLAGMKIEVIDGFGEAHQLDVEPDAKMLVSSNA
jgi:hypothetical protein